MKEFCSTENTLSAAAKDIDGYDFSGAKVIGVLIIRIFGGIVPISFGIILNALCYLLVSKYYASIIGQGLPANARPHGFVVREIMYSYVLFVGSGY